MLIGGGGREGGGGAGDTHDVTTKKDYI